MNKKLIILVLLAVCISYVYQEFIPIGYTVNYQGDSFDVGEKTVTIKKISQSNAVIEVDGVKNIVSVGDEKIINEVNIKVVSIFYVDEAESRNVDLVVKGLSSTTTSTPEEEESPESEDECWQASNCDDGNPETTDLCMGTPKKCINKIFLECETDIDCDDGNKCTNDECKNNECFNTNIANCDAKETGEVSKEEEGQMEGIIPTEGFFSKLIGFIANLF